MEPLPRAWATAFAATYTVPTEAAGKGADGSRAAQQERIVKKFPISAMCRLLGVSRAAFSDAQKRTTLKPTASDQRLPEDIRSIFHARELDILMPHVHQHRLGAFEAVQTLLQFAANAP